MRSIYNRGPRAGSILPVRLLSDGDFVSPDASFREVPGEDETTSGDRETSESGVSGFFIPGSGAVDLGGSTVPSRPSSVSPVSHTRKNLQQYSGEQIQSSREISRDEGNSFRPAISSSASRSSHCRVQRRSACA